MPVLEFPLGRGALVAAYGWHHKRVSRNFLTDNKHVFPEEPMKQNVEHPAKGKNPFIIPGN